MKRTMDFILEQQAQLNVTVDKLSVKIDRNAEGIAGLLAIAEIQAAEIRDLTGTTRDLRESIQSLAVRQGDAEAWQREAQARQREAEERGRRTDERLDALINVVERHISEGRNGKA